MTPNNDAVFKKTLYKTEKNEERFRILRPLQKFKYIYILFKILNNQSQSQSEARCK